MTDDSAPFSDFENWVEERGGKVIPHLDGVALMPSKFFDEEELPAVDQSHVVEQKDGIKNISVPVVWAATRVQGRQLLAPEHVAYMWVTATQRELLAEHEFRKEYDFPIPPIVKRAVDDERGEIDD